ncbi:TetR family transcriptional regulator [Thiohalorhabdus methylotrophus]|uniref:TetR family transcriptional regulator n=1 Tax=Thiohalorhabdus methylotrophus TaxID=3242694 RepID=A0ABV4U2G6_9GAMM
MTDEPLTADRILDAAEEVLRRFGPSKTTVVDVARALDVSHGTIYRHFPNKAALRDAVAERWLARVSAPLEAIAAEKGPADDRLRRWLQALAWAKRRKVLDDPELFATYHALAEQARGVVDAHVEALIGQLARIIQDGMAAGIFTVTDARAAARAVFDATMRFHHPAHSAQWQDPGIDEAFEEVLQMVLAALAGRHPD